MWLKHTAFQVGFNDCAWRTTLLIQWIQLKSLTATTWTGIKRRISRILHFQCTWKLHGNALDYPTISNLVSDGCGSWISHKHSLWCSVLKPQHFRLLTLRWDSSLPTSKWPAASWEHWTSQPWTFKSCKAAASIPTEHLGWNSFLFPVLWPNLLGFTHGHFNVKVLFSGWSHHPPPPLPNTPAENTLLWLSLPPLVHYIVLFTSPSELYFKIYLSLCPLCVGQWDMSPLCLLLLLGTLKRNSRQL